MPTLQEIYDSAASVEAQTGVDPAIVAALAQTEGPTVDGSPMSLGIQTGAPTGAGSSGRSLGSATPNAAAVGQPSRFWAYNSGAEAAQALSAYIGHQFPQASAELGNASSFFNAMIGTNYYVPMSGQQSKSSYWNQKVGTAQQLATEFGGAVVNSVSGAQSLLSSGASLVSGASSTTSTSSSGTSSSTISSSGGGQFTLVPALNGPGFTWPGIKISTGFLWSVGFFVLAGLLIVVGLLIVFRRQVEQGAVVAAKAAGV